MIEKIKYLFKNVGILTISQFSSKILIFFLLPLYTNVLSTEQYGVYDLSVTVVELLYPILTINIIDAVMRFLLDKKYENTDVISVSFKYVFLSILLASSIALAVSLFNLFPLFEGLEIYVLLYFIFYTLQQFAAQVAKGLEQITDIGISGVLGTVCLIGFNLFFLLVAEWGLVGFFLANILAHFIPALYLILRTTVWRYIRLSAGKMISPDMLKYCVPLIVNTLGWWANSATDKFVVTFFLGAAANGILSIAYKIPNMLSAVQGIFNQGWQISAIKEFEEKGDTSFFSKIVLLINGVMFVGASFLILLTKPLASFLYAKDFYVAWEYVPMLILSVVINTNSGIYGAILAAKGRSNGMAISSFIGIVVNVALNILLVWAIGMQGVTIATVISGLVILLLRKIISGADFKTKWDKFIYLSLALVVAQSLCKIYIREWYVLALELLIFVFIATMYAVMFFKDMKKKPEEKV
ncbi:MAG: oligosaccharide flippase family protein [Clostridia bacterium]|nr:oligosaccharide flippase family protein [Clostridia bacterium]